MSESGERAQPELNSAGCRGGVASGANVKLGVLAKAVRASRLWAETQVEDAAAGCGNDGRR